MFLTTFVTTPFASKKPTRCHGKSRCGDSKVLFQKERSSLLWKNFLQPHGYIFGSNPPPTPTTVESEGFKGSTKRVLPHALHGWYIYLHLVDFYNIKYMDAMGTVIFVVAVTWSGVDPRYILLAHKASKSFTFDMSIHRIHQLFHMRFCSSLSCQMDILNIQFSHQKCSSYGGFSNKDRTLSGMDGYLDIVRLVNLALETFTFMW